jgi:ATPase subunit of ABC transporter with duplicated ATPase domains
MMKRYSFLSVILIKIFLTFNYLHAASCLRAIRYYGVTTAVRSCVKLCDIGMEFGGKVLFEKVKLQLSPPNRYALVGANGTGKSTLLKIISRVLAPSEGYVESPNNWRFGMLDQEAKIDLNDIPVNASFQSLPPLYRAWKERQELWELIDACGVTESDSATGMRLAELEGVISDYDGYAVEQRAKTILRGLGINTQMQRQSLSTLSGGYRLKVLFGSILVPNPEALLLDEPNNHLDTYALNWLGDFLIRDYKGLLVFTSHDQNFVSKVATHVLDLDYQTVTVYRGSYSQFLSTKESQELQRSHQIKSLEKKVETIKGFVEKNRAGVRAQQAQSRLKLLDKLEIPEALRTTYRPPLFRFVPKVNSGSIVFDLQKVTKGYPGLRLFSNIDLTVHRKERLAVLGRNGSGKSTFLQIVAGRIAPDDGIVRVGLDVQLSYLVQNWDCLTFQDNTLMDWIQGNVSASQDNVERTLRQCLFFYEDYSKKIKDLSGGEKIRLNLAKIMLEHGNTLILDEPTNHLDRLAVIALRNALMVYEGTVIFTSHHEDFVKDVATRHFFIK